VSDFRLMKFPNFQAYRDAQVRANEEKQDVIWVDRENIEFLSRYILTKIPHPTFGLCHGTRQGKEQEWFHEFLGCDVLGTEISPSADTYPNTIEWDFHKIKAEWIVNTDFIYSNSIDHSYNPEKCLNAWVKCLKPRGLIILEHSMPGHGPDKVTESDPFGVDFPTMCSLLDQWGKGNNVMRSRYEITDILTGPSMREDMDELNYIVIERA